MSFYQRECNNRGVRIYPITFYSMYLLEIEFNKTATFDPVHVQSIVRGETKYNPKKKEWIEKTLSKYKEIYEVRIQPRLKLGKTVLPGTIRGIYKETG